MTENKKDPKMSTESNTALKEALYTQQQLLQKLYNELEVEREASATAASEALAMILRLQGEKAAVKMESEHYKRLSDEKMYHAEESMEIFEELVQQKDMEIASLDCQVQAYRYKLLSLGYEDFESNEIKSTESSLHSNENSVMVTSPENLLRRNSAPPKLLKLAYMKRNNLERNRSVSPDSDIISKTLEDENNRNVDSEKQTENSLSVDNINSYWDQIRKLDKIVEEMAGDQYLTLKTRSSSAFSQLNDSDKSQSQSQRLKKSKEDEMLSDTCTSVHDVFEVPETNENDKLIKNTEKLSKFPEVDMKLYEKTLLKQKDKEVFFPKEGVVVECHMAIDQGATYAGESQGSTQRVNITTEITEGDSLDVRSQEQVEVLRLLNEINVKLDSIQSEIKRGKTETKKPTPDYDLPMLQLQEAMLHFWL